MGYAYDQQEMRTKAFQFIYGCAMRDAILQRAFKGDKIWVGQVHSAKSILDNYIRKLLTNEFATQKAHDRCFLETANNICRAINDCKPADVETDVFSFGNAQKLINITVKHTYTFCYEMPSLRACFRFCHCPLDAIMLDKVWRLSKDKFELGKKQDFCKPWGAEGIINNEQPHLSQFPARYSLFQSAIRQLIAGGDIFPIEFDYIEWKNEPPL